MCALAATATNAQATPGSGDMEITVPDGVGPGQLLLVTAPDGTDLEVAVPDGLSAGAWHTWPCFVAPT